MEVDPLPMAGGSASMSVENKDGDMPLNPLKRSNSAPMINVLVATSTVTMTTMSETMETSSPSLSGAMKPLERVRRFSTSSMALNVTPPEPPFQTPVNIPSRLVQIKREERIPQREVAHEREIQSAMQLSQSMEEIVVDESHPPISMPVPITGPGPPPLDPTKRPKSLGEPLHIHVSQYYPYASSPSPTRLGKQCFSPSLQQPVYRTGPLTPSPSPSPTRKSFASPLSRRSLSPITLRPSPLGNPGTKRKMDLDGEKMDTYCSPAKRFQPSCSPGGCTPDKGHMMYHQLIHSSLSSSSFDGCNSPDQRVPNVSSATGQPSSTSSPSFFRPVRESTESQGTDSETSDITEPTDMSEPADGSSAHLSGLSHLSDSVVEESMQASTMEIFPTPVPVVTLSASVHSASSPSVSSMSPQLSVSSESSATSSSSPLTQPMSTMSVSSVPTSSVSQSVSEVMSQVSVLQSNADIQYYAVKVTKV